MLLLRLAFQLSFLFLSLPRSLSSALFKTGRRGDNEGEREIKKKAGKRVVGVALKKPYFMGSCKADLSSLFLSLRDGELAGRADGRGGALAGPRGRWRATWPGHVGGGASGWTARGSC